MKTVQIIAVMPARVTVDNRRDRSDSATMGTILGALAGAAVGAVVSDSPDAVVAGTASCLRGHRVPNHWIRSAAQTG